MTLIRKLSFGGLLAGCLTAMSLPAYAGPYEDGVAADSDRNYAASFPAFQKAVEQGHVKAHLKLGNHYQYGKGVSKSANKAIELYKIAGDLGEPTGYAEIGYIYAEGLGTSKSPAKSVEWYRKAAEAGHYLGQYKLGLAYRDGLGVAKNESKATYWFGLGAAQGHMMSRGQMDIMNARGVTAWQPPASNSALPEGSSLYQPNKAAPEPIDKIASLKSKAQAGDVSAQESLGLRYYHGNGVAQSYEDAALWIEKAAIERELEAMVVYARLWENGWGVRQNDGHAKFWYEQAANQGSAEAKAWVDRKTLSSASAVTVAPVAAVTNDNRKKLASYDLGLPAPTPVNMDYVKGLGSACNRKESYYFQYKDQVSIEYLMDMLSDCAAAISEINYIQRQNSNYFAVTDNIYDTIALDISKYRGYTAIFSAYFALLNAGNDNDDLTDDIVCNILQERYKQAKLSEVIDKGNTSQSQGEQELMDQACVNLTDDYDEPGLLHKIGSMVYRVSDGDYDKAIARIVTLQSKSGHGPSAQTLRDN